MQLLLPTVSVFFVLAGAVGVGYPGQSIGSQYPAGRLAIAAEPLLDLGPWPSIPPPAIARPLRPDPGTDSDAWNSTMAGVTVALNTCRLIPEATIAYGSLFQIPSPGSAQGFATATLPAIAATLPEPAHWMTPACALIVISWIARRKLDLWRA